MRVVNLNSDNNITTKKVLKNRGKSMNNVVKILPYKVKDMGLSKLGRYQIGISEKERNCGTKQTTETKNI